MILFSLHVLFQFRGIGLSIETMSVMASYSWPGNVRQLQCTIRFTLVKSGGRTVQPEHLPLELKACEHPWTMPGPSRKLDPESVKSALKKTAGNKARAARVLGMGRNTLYRFIADYPLIP